MKILRLTLLALLILAAHSKPCNAQVFTVTSTASFIAGQPQAIYETNPGGTASVTVTGKGAYTCKNLTATGKIAYLHKYVQIDLVRQTTFVHVLDGDATASENPFVGAGMTWTGSLTATKTGAVAINLYTAHSSPNIEETKTGEFDADLATTPVEVRPYA